MSTKAYVERLSRALEGTGYAQVAKSTFAENRVSVLCRVAKDAEPKWTELLKRMLQATEAEEGHAHTWQSHFCRNYFLKEDKLVFGWNISIQSTEMGTSLDYLIRVIKGEQPGAASKAITGQIDEMPLAGTSSDRGKAKNGKGAFTVGGSDDFRPRR